MSDNQITGTRSEPIVFIEHWQFNEHYNATLNGVRLALSEAIELRDALSEAINQAEES
jgi:hypothetical protein